MSFNRSYAGAAVATLMAVGSIATMPAAYAHPGGLAKDGCHKDNKNGGRHCHRGSNTGANKKATAPRSGTSYANCTEARNAGAAPVRRGDPGYGTHLDRDNDGIGCE